MAYTKQTWADGQAGGTPISAARLNYLENGIQGAAETAFGLTTPGQLTEAIQDAVAAFVRPGTNVTVAYDDTAGTLTVNAAGGGGDTEVVADPTGNAATDTAAIQNAINTVGAAGGGIVQLGVGEYVITPNTLSVNHDDITIRGHGGQATILRKAAAGRLLDISGPDGTLETMRRRIRVADLELHGADLEGELVRSYYAQFIVFTRVLFHANWGVGFSAVQHYDSLFERCRFDFVHGNVWTGQVTSMAAVHIKLADQGVTSGFGSSADNCNNINFADCTWEQNEGHDVWLDGRLADGTYNGGRRNNKITFSGRTKMESMTGAKKAPFLRVAGATDVNFSALQITLGPATTAVNYVETAETDFLDLGHYHAEAIENGTPTIRSAISVGANVRQFRGDIAAVVQTTNKPTVALAEWTGSGRAGNTIAVNYIHNPGGAQFMVGNPNSDASNMWSLRVAPSMTQVAYNALAAKDPTTLYPIVG